MIVPRRILAGSDTDYLCQLSRDELLGFTALLHILLHGFADFANLGGGGRCIACVLIVRREDFA